MYSIESLKDFFVKPKIFKYISKGSYGKVYTDGKLIYKKIIAKTETDIQNLFSEINIQNEAYNIRIKNKMSFTNMAIIPKIHHVYKTKNPYIFYIVMDNSGTSFYKSFHNKKMTLRESCLVMYQILELLNYLQKKIKFTHRDLHLDNVLIHPSKLKNSYGDKIFYVSLIDFGFSRIQKGSKIISSHSFFISDNFSPYFDIGFMLYDFFRHFLHCHFLDLENYKCKIMSLPKELTDNIVEILNATGVHFNTIRGKSDLYDILYNTNPIHPKILNIKRIQKILVKILKVLKI